MADAKDIRAELREATTLSAMSLTGAAVAVAAIVAVIAVFLFADSERQRDLDVWEGRLGIVAETRAAAVDEWIGQQYRELGALAENASLQLYMTELSRPPAPSGRLTEEFAESGYLRNLLTVVAGKAGYLSEPGGPDIGANVERVAVSGIALVGSGGEIFAATRGMPPLDPVRHRDVLAPPGEARGLLDIHVAPNGEAVIGFSVPVYGIQQGGAARALGRVVGIRRVDHALFDLLKQPGFAWTSSEILLVRGRDGAAEYLSPRRGGRPPLSDTHATGTRDVVAAIVVRDGARFGTAPDYTGASVLYAARPLAGVPWSA
ncbi:MAG: hypothetical protein WD470_09830, partial [Rhodospirillaceae bacterium]